MELPIRQKMRDAVIAIYDAADFLSPEHPEHISNTDVLSVAAFIVKAILTGLASQSGGISVQAHRDQFMAMLDRLLDDKKPPV